MSDFQMILVFEWLVFGSPLYSYDKTVRGNVTYPV